MYSTLIKNFKCANRFEQFKYDDEVKGVNKTIYVCMFNAQSNSKGNEVRIICRTAWLMNMGEQLVDEIRKQREMRSAIPKNII